MQYKHTLCSMEETEKENSWTVIPMKVLIFRRGFEVKVVFSYLIKRVLKIYLPSALTFDSEKKNYT